MQAQIIVLLNDLEVGQDLEDIEKVFRFDITRGAVRSGTALAHLDSLRPAIERHAHMKLTACSHLAMDYIPPILKLEVSVGHRAAK